MVSRRRRAPLVAGVIAAALGGCVPFATPPGPVVADRPGYTDTPTALPAGAVQLEAGITDDRVQDTRYVSAGETLLRLGVGAKAELRLFGNSYATRTISGSPRRGGIEDPKIGAKLNLRAVPDTVHAWLPNVAALAAITLPVGASGFGATRAQPEAKVAANWTTPSPLSAYTNFGYGRTYDGARWGSHAWMSLALWYAANPRVSLFGEGLAVGRLQGGATAGNDLDAGVTFLLTDRFQLDMRVGRGVGSETSHERFIGAGLARRW
ncbi:MAG: transporter [bacterium]